METFRHSWIRTEYLIWNISGPGDALLGEQTLSGVGRNNLITPGPANISISDGVLFSPGAVNGISGVAQTPSLSGLSNSNLNGFRGTFGVPIPTGALEFSGFVLAEHHDQYQDADINIPGTLIQRQIDANAAATIGGTTGLNGLAAQNGQSATFISQAALLGGARSDTTFINYDVNYHARLTTAVWGTEGNYVMDSPDPNSPFQLRPSFGFRYLSFHDALDQDGQYFTDTTRTTIATRHIDSAVYNNLYGPQIGLRSELSFYQALIGFEPKLMMGLNTWESDLTTSQVFSAADPTKSLLQRGTTFAPLVDLKAYTNIALTKNMSFFFAYNFIWSGSLIRSYNDIVYNKNAISTNSDFSLLKNYTSATIQGLSFGCEFRY